MINKDEIKQDLIKMINTLKIENNAEKSAEIWSSKMAEIIEKSILSADVVQVQTTVTTAGSATAQTGTGVQTGTGKLQ